jgi:hypothetical protein
MVQQAMTTMTATQKNAIMQQLGLGAIVDSNAQIMMANSKGFEQGIMGTVAQIESGNFNLEQNLKLQGQSNDQYRKELVNFREIGQAGLVGGLTDLNKSLSDQTLVSDKVTEDAVKASVEAAKKTKTSK